MVRKTQQTENNQRIDNRKLEYKESVIKYKKNRKLECKEPVGETRKNSWLQTLKEMRPSLVRVLGAVLIANVCAGAMQIAAGSRIGTSPVDLWI